MYGTSIVTALSAGLLAQSNGLAQTAIAAGVAIGILFGGSFLLAIWLIARRRFGHRLLGEAKENARKLAEDALRQSDTLLKEAKIDAREEHLRSQQEFAEETRDRRREIGRLERRIIRREEKLERRTSAFEDRERELVRLETKLGQKLKRAEVAENEANRKRDEAVGRLERVAGQTSDQAKQALIQLLQHEAREEATTSIRRIEENAKASAKKQADQIISTAIQRAASNHVAEHTVSVVELPSDDMKGRVIGREGRNIRAFEMVTGVNLIVDDTPEAVLISTFDPLRREVARLALEQLVGDGRIHPSRIEEVVERIRAEIEEQIQHDGAEAAADLGIHELHTDLIRLIGTLKFRTSYGQNVLKHSVEVATIAGILASELGVDAIVARRAGLLHDVGKAVDHEIEGTHLTIGIDLLRRYGESDAVIHGMEAHHFDVEPKTVEAVLVQAADALSAARPGARRDMLETYVKRLQKLEEIADAFNGVSKAYAIQAGRELRIIVESDQVSDNEAIWLSKDIAKRIEKEVQYPGEIKVTVIRETRAVGLAR
jgi:ribonuclease Y